MIAFDMAIAAGIVMDGWLLAFVSIRGRRTWLQATFAALSLTCIVNGAAYIGTREALLDPAWAPIVLLTEVLTYPLTAILVLALIHGESLPRGRPAAFLLLVPAPLLVFLTPDLNRRGIYDLTPLGAYLSLCVGIALAEPLYQRIATRLHSEAAAWLLVGVLALVIGGPVYAFELEGLGYSGTAGSNIASPFALAVFALVALRGAPYSVVAKGPRGRARSRASALRGTVIVLEEHRPVYTVRTVRQAAAEGRPTLLVARSYAPSTQEGPGSSVAFVEPNRHAASRVLATACEFMARTRGATVGLVDLGDISLLSGWEPTREMIQQLLRVARGTGSTLLLSTACLLPDELASLKATQVASWPMPDPSVEFESILAKSFGTGAAPLLGQYSSSRGLQPTDLTLDDVPLLVDFLTRAIAELGGPVADSAARRGLADQAATVARGLQEFAARSASDLASGRWPSREGDRAEESVLVTARDYWKGTEPGALLASADRIAGSEPVFERARVVFVEELGQVGEAILRSGVEKLGRQPETLRRDDMTRLADRAEVDLIAIADVVDVPQERLRLRAQIESVRRRLEAISGGG